MPKLPSLAPFLLLAAACTREPISLDGMPCDLTDPVHACLSGYTCNQDLRCMRFLLPSCELANRCPETAAGAPCPSPGALMPCELAESSCRSHGCFVCGEDLRWSGCQEEICELGKTWSCSACDDDCTLSGRIQNATPSLRGEPRRPGLRLRL